jgi:hypothetical protein
MSSLGRQPLKRTEISLVPLASALQKLDEKGCSARRAAVSRPASFGPEPILCAVSDTLCSAFKV